MKNLTLSMCGLMIVAATGCGPQTTEVGSPPRATTPPQIAADSTGDSMLTPSAVAAASVPITENAKSPSSPGRVTAEVAVPDQTFGDWATYGDALAVVRVTAIDRKALSPEEERQTEGVLVGKTVAIDVEQVLWARDQQSGPPKQITFETLGWIRRNGHDDPVVLNAAPAIEVGDRLVAVLSRWRTGWEPLSTSALIRIGADGLLTVPDADPATGYRPTPALTMANRKTRGQLAIDVAPIPLDAKLTALDPVGRHAALTGN